MLHFMALFCTKMIIKVINYTVVGLKMYTKGGFGKALSFRPETSCCRPGPCEFLTCFWRCKFYRTAGRQFLRDSERLQCGGSCSGVLCRSRGSRSVGRARWLRRRPGPPARTRLPSAAASARASRLPVPARPGLRRRSRSSLKLEGRRELQKEQLLLWLLRFFFFFRFFFKKT
jgi:hypothetical protein